MAAFAGRRLLLSLITLLLASLFVFAATEVLPGDPASQLLGKDASPELVANLRAQLELDRPATERFGDWIASSVQGDLGTSVVSQEPVTSELGPRLRNTLLLAGVTIVLGITLSLICGIVAALTRDRLPDVLISVLSLICISVPEFVLATTLVLLFSITWPIFPAVVVADVNAPLSELLPAIWLPVAALTCMLSAYIIRMLRTSLIDVMASEHVMMAQLKGLSTSRIVLRHALPSALAPTINVVAVIVAWLIGGVVVVETVFNYPGIGAYAVQAVQNRDLPVLQALALLGAVTYVVTSLLADLAALALDPRLRARRM
jgi:peptide/nickel transport system permease protein